jgi:hypothetical protein
MITAVAPLLADVLEQTPAYVMLQVYGPTNALVTPGTITSLDYRAFDMLTSPPTQLAANTIAINTAVFNTPVNTDPRWTRDNTGYNFAYLFPANTFPSDRTRVRIEINFTPTGGEKFTRRVDCRVAQLYSR